MRGEARQPQEAKKKKFDGTWWAVVSIGTSIGYLAVGNIFRGSMVGMGTLTSLTHLSFWTIQALCMMALFLQANSKAVATGLMVVCVIVAYGFGVIGGLQLEGYYR